MTGQCAATIVKIRSLAAEGLFCFQIAERLDICKQYVWDLAKQNKIPLAQAPRTRRRTPEQIRAADIHKKFRRHRMHAKRRGVPFLLTEEEWWGIWKESGRWEDRRPGGYVMCRHGDSGAYELGNVRIDTQAANTLEWHHSTRSAKRLTTSVEAPPHHSNHQQHASADQRSAAGACEISFSHGRLA